MTVGELRKSLEGVPDDLLVIATYDGSQHTKTSTAAVRPIQQWWQDGGWELPDVDAFVIGEHHLR